MTSVYGHISFLAHCLCNMWPGGDDVFEYVNATMLLKKQWIYMNLWSLENVENFTSFQLEHWLHKYIRLIILNAFMIANVLNFLFMFNFQSPQNDPAVGPLMRKFLYIHFIRYTLLYAYCCWGHIKALSLINDAAQWLCYFKILNLLDLLRLIVCKLGVDYIVAIVQVLILISKSNPIILYIRDVEHFVCRSERVYSLFQKMLTKLSGHVIILGSRLSEPDNCCKDVDARLTTLFPYNIEIKPPEDENHLVSWKSQLEKDTKTIQIQDNRNHITEVLAANDLECDDLGTICLSDILVLSTYIEEIVVSAVSYHLMNNKDPQYRNGKLVITSKRSVGLW